MTDSDNSDELDDWIADLVGDCDSLNEWLTSPEACALIEALVKEPIDPTRWREAMAMMLSVAWSFGCVAGRRERCGEP